MAALVQTIPQHSSTVPVLQTRPSSSSGTFVSSSAQNPGSHYQNMSWGSFNTGNSGSYRAGHQVVAPYAYAPNPAPSASSPTTQHRQSWSPHLRPEHRAFSAPAIHQGSLNPQFTGNSRVNNPAAGSVSTSSSSNSSFRSHISKDDSALPSRQLRTEQPLRPLSTANLPPPNVMNISSPAGSAKPSPNRYRRANQQRTESARSHSPASVTTPPASDDKTAVSPGPVLRSNGHNRVSSVDDSSHLERPQLELAKRYRRRSMGNMDPAAYPNLELQMPLSSSPQSGPYDFIAFDTNQRPRSAHSHRDSSGSVHSAHSSTSSVREGPSHDAGSVISKTARPEEKRPSKPSPLSQPSTSPESPKTAPTTSQPTTASSPPTESPAAKRLAELKNEPKRPGKSRLRRAFSFGSASELLKQTSAQNATNKREAAAAEQARRDALREELGEEQAAIAEQQEASGLGESIYSHQGNFFRGSTDALSVSSTASSASMMLRKMGKGMKRGGRSLVGLFRPKSIASINSIEGGVGSPEQPMAAPKISVVNVEGERADLESVTVNPDLQDVPRGGTVFPKAEGGSEPRRSASIRDRPQQRSVSDNTGDTRKSILGGERERAEVLANIRQTRGILKKTNSDLGVSSQARAQNGSESPHSSAPTTPDEGVRAARPTEHVKIAGEDYFMDGGRYSGGDAKSAPINPQAGSRNIMFSPRIQFHDTWPSGEYDRRGDIATCNRLTPLLAQQIREEINNFKMEMEVHENSKIYTHFI